MGRVDIILDDEVEELLRNRIKKKGDMSQIINEALQYWLNKEQP